MPGFASVVRLDGRLSGGPDLRPESEAARADRAPRPASLARVRARESPTASRAAAPSAAWRQARAVSAVGDSDHAARPSDSREEPARADRPPAAALRPEDESGRHVESAPSADQPEDPAWSQVEVLNVAARREPGMDGRALAAAGGQGGPAAGGWDGTAAAEGKPPATPGGPSRPADNGIGLGVLASGATGRTAGAAAKAPAGVLTGPLLAEPLPEPTGDQGIPSIRLELEPEDLGRIRLHVALADRTVYASLVTEQAGLREYLIEHRDWLEAELGAQGLAVGSFFVSTTGRERNQSETGAPFPGTAPEPSEATGPVETPGIEPTAGPDGKSGGRRALNLFA
ncbi:flagellar hook-length control protein FliK [Nitrospira sp. Kam-Ns4a]